MAKITRMTSSKYRIIKEHSRKLLWFLPTIGGILLILAIVFAKGYVKSDRNKTMPKLLVHEKMESVIKPLKLLGFSLESGYPEFHLPRTLIETRLNFIQKMCSFSTIAIIDAKKMVRASLGEKKEVELFKRMNRIFKVKSLISPVINRKTRQLEALVFSVPLQPRKSISMWIIGKIDIKTFTNGFPAILSFKSTAETLKHPIHPASPNISVKIAPLSRPIWPMLLGIILIIIGIFVIIASPGWVSQTKK